MKRLYRVTVADEVIIDCVYAGTPAFLQGQESAIKRESIVIEHFHENAARGRLQGTFYFTSLDNARSYALLNLQAAQERLAANMDRTLRFDGSDDGSGRDR